MSANIRASRKFLENNVNLDSVLKLISLLDCDEILFQLVGLIKAEQFFEAAGHTLSEEEIKQNLNRIRLDKSLATSDETKNWLGLKGLHGNDLLDWAKSDLVLSRVKELIAGDRIEAVFELNRLSYDEVELYKLVVKSRDVAHELACQVLDGADFFGLTKQYSIDTATQKNCGYMGWVRRAVLAPEVEASVFSSKEHPRLIGPLKVAGAYHLYWIDAFQPANLNSDVRDEIEEQLFAEWLQSCFDEQDSKFVNQKLHSGVETFNCDPDQQPDCNSSSNDSPETISSRGEQIT